jgi:hypothetical protein
LPKLKDGREFYLPAATSEPALKNGGIGEPSGSLKPRAFIASSRGEMVSRLRYSEMNNL